MLSPSTSKPVNYLHCPPPPRQMAKVLPSTESGSSGHVLSRRPVAVPTTRDRLDIRSDSRPAEMGQTGVGAPPARHQLTAGCGKKRRRPEGDGVVTAGIPILALQADVRPARGVP